MLTTICLATMGVIGFGVAVLVVLKGREMFRRLKNPGSMSD